MPKSDKSILIYGSQEFGRTIEGLVIDCGYKFIGYIDDFNEGEDILGDFNHACSKFNPADYFIALAVGYKNLQARYEVFLKVKEAGYKISTLIHPSSYVSLKTSINEGCIVMAGSTIDLNTTLKEIVVVWPGVVINHDCLIGTNSFLSPNFTICGSVKIGRNCFIGAGAVIVDHVDVPDSSFTKAGTIFK